jgi:hypothetical protein
MLVREGEKEEAGEGREERGERGGWREARGGWREREKEEGGRSTSQFFFQMAPPI